MEHCRRSNAGLYYADRWEFTEALKLLMKDSHLRAAMGRNGKAYVNRHYRWSSILQEVRAALSGHHRHGAGVGRAGPRACSGAPERPYGSRRSRAAGAIGTSAAIGRAVRIAIGIVSGPAARIATAAEDR